MSLVANLEGDRLKLRIEGAFQGFPATSRWRFCPSPQSWVSGKAVTSDLHVYKYGMVDFLLEELLSLSIMAIWSGLALWEYPLLLARAFGPCPSSSPRPPQIVFSFEKYKKILFTVSLQADVTMNIISKFQKIINKNKITFFFFVNNTSIIQ